MNFERDQAIDAVVLMFWMSCRGVVKPVLSKLAWPHRNDTTGVSVSLQQIKWIEVQSTVEEQLDVVQEQQSLPGSLVGQVTQQVRGLEVATRARYCEQLSSERSGHIQNGRISAFGQLSEKAYSFRIVVDRSTIPACYSGS